MKVNRDAFKENYTQVYPDAKKGSIATSWRKRYSIPGIKPGHVKESEFTSQGIHFDGIQSQIIERSVKQIFNFGCYGMVYEPGMV